MATSPAPAPSTDTQPLQERLLKLDRSDAARLIEEQEPAAAAAALEAVGPEIAVQVLDALPDEACALVVAAASEERRVQWRRNAQYPPDSVGRLMDHPFALFDPDSTVAEAIRHLRELTRRAFITYGWVTDEHGKLLGVLVFRELLLAMPEQRLAEVMLRDPFSLRPETPLPDAMREVLTRHFPVYPVVDAEGRLVGVVRGHALFQHEAISLTAQPGQMVGVAEEERLGTPWWRSLRFRHPWLQLNLLTAFLAAAVVGTFEETINQIVLLAAFLPVLAGQSGNTGCQALAVTLRGMTLGELEKPNKRVLGKEALLGFLNGAFVGVPASLAMYFYARSQDYPNAVILSGVVLLAMTGSCLISGVSGTLIPMALRRLGADPATASSIFVTTATDVVSMGMLLGLATVLVL